MKDYRDRITEEAADWFAKMQDHEPRVEDHAAFADWLSASPEHVREYLCLTSLRTDLSELSSAPAAAELFRLATPSHDVNVIAAPFGALPAENRNTLRRYRSRRSLALAAAVALVALGSILWMKRDANTASYVTSIGEQKSFPLPDGSLITLNAVSRLELQFAAGRRDVRLLSGEALFDVTKNPARPFRVLTDDSVIQVIGTRFNVHHRDVGTTVTVVEGAVQVRNFALETPPVRLTKDERARVQPREPRIAVSKVNAALDTAWRERRLVFESRPLDEVVAEFNLYNSVPIEIEAESLDKVLVSGSFYANDPRSFALFLQEARLAQTRVAPDRIRLWPVEKNGGRFADFPISVEEGTHPTKP
jgi:transmembrane sensor